jgi:hypothetical protein
MKGLAALLLTLSVALTVTTSAAAKELKEVKICGPASCARVTDATAMDRLTSAVGDARGPSPVAGYYAVTVTVAEGDQESSWQVYYIPSSRLVRGIGQSGRAEWLTLSADTVAAFDAAAVGLAAFEKPVLSGASVGGKAVRGDATSYLDLYSVGTPYRGSTRNAPWVKIELRSSAATPWTDGNNTLGYSPKRHLLRRDGQIVRVSKALGNRLMRRVALN